MSEEATGERQYAEAIPGNPRNWRSPVLFFLAETTERIFEMAKNELKNLNVSGDMEIEFEAERFLVSTKWWWNSVHDWYPMHVWVPEKSVHVFMDGLEYEVNLDDIFEQEEKSAADMEEASKIVYEIVAVIIATVSRTFTVNLEEFTSASSDISLH